jgi:hypothetical protein
VPSRPTPRRAARSPPPIGPHDQASCSFPEPQPEETNPEPGSRKCPGAPLLGVGRWERRLRPQTLAVCGAAGRAGRSERRRGALGPSRSGPARDWTREPDSLGAIRAGPRRSRRSRSAGGRMVVRRQPGAGGPTGRRRCGAGGARRTTKPKGARSWGFWCHAVFPGGSTALMRNRTASRLRRRCSREAAKWRNRAFLRGV